MRRRFHIPRDVLAQILPFKPKRSLTVNINVGPKAEKTLRELRRKNPEEYARVLMRYRQYKYLGDEVRDTNRPGLDSIAEWRRIKAAVLEDYRAGRIDARTARGRLLLLRLLLKKHLLKKGYITKAEYRQGLEEWRDAWENL